MNDLPDDDMPDFTAPLALLHACHEKILGQCETLEKLVAHARDAGIDDEAKAAARQVHRYFTQAAPLHHQDEEIDLFPILQRQSLKLADVVYSLKQEHPQLDMAWQQLAPDLAQLQQVEDLQSFADRVDDFCSRYRKHVQRENEELLDVAQHILSSKQQRELGEAMAERRNVRVRSEE